jgi:hypothetical protein
MLHENDIIRPPQTTPTNKLRKNFGFPPAEQNRKNIEENH